MTQVIINEVNAVVGEGFDSTVHKFKGDFLAYTLRLQFDEERTVILDDIGKAKIVFVSDSTITECGQTGGNINNFRGDTDVLFATTVQPITIFDRINDLPIVTSKAPAFGEKFQITCGETVNGIPRDSRLIFKVDGDFQQEIPVKTGITQQNFVVKCTRNFSLNGIVKCASNFGFGAILQN